MTGRSRACSGFAILALALVIVAILAVACPNLVWIEVAAAVRRGIGDPELAGERGLRGAVPDVAQGR